MTTSESVIRKRRSGLAAWLFAIAAIGCTAFSTNTSYRYLRGHLGFTDPRELYGAFVLLELLLVACAVGARQNLQDPKKQAPGAPGLLVWALAGFAAIPAFSVSGSLFAGLFRLVLGPIMAVVSFHLALGMELRHKRPNARSESTVRRIGRDLGQRLVSVLGLGARDVSAQDLTRQRAIVRAARTVVAMRRTPDGSRRYVRLGRRLDRALRIAEVDGDAARVDALLARIAVAQHSEALTSIKLASPWADRPVVASAVPSGPDEADRPDRTEPDETDRPDELEASVRTVRTVRTEPDELRPNELEASVRTADEADEAPTLPVGPWVPEGPDAEIIPMQRESRRRREASAEDRPDRPDERPAGRRRGGPTDLVRQHWDAYGDDTGTLRKIVAEELPEISGETIERAIRRVRGERTA